MRILCATLFLAVNAFGTDLRLVGLDLGDIDVVVLLVGPDLELLHYQILGDLRRLRFEVRHLIGRDGSRSHDHRCGHGGHERQAHYSHPDTGKLLHSASETWLRRRAFLGAGHDCQNV